jgi:hypothetical protein
VVALWTVVLVGAKVVVAPVVAAVVSGTVVLSALVGGVVDVSVTDEVVVFVLWWPEEAGAEVGGEADFELSIEQPVSRTAASSHIRRDTAPCISDRGPVAHDGIGPVQESGRHSRRRVQIGLGEPVPKAPIQVFGSAQVGHVEIATVILGWLSGDPRVLDSPG